MSLSHVIPPDALFVALGDPAAGDDAVGLELGKRLEKAGARVLHAGVNPECCLHHIVPGETVVLIDAADLGAVPGTVAWIPGTKAVARFPQISTHRLSLGLLCRYLEDHTGRPAWILAIQPSRLTPGAPLSPEIRAAVDLLAAELASHLLFAC